jgi:hypothetical protein
MSKKKINVDSMVNELEGASLYFKKQAPSQPISPLASVTPQALETQEKKVTYKPTQISKDLSKSLSKTISTDDVELLDFQLRKVHKFRVNADIPEEWKEELDTLGFKLKVGKYELVTFIIGQFLGKVKIKDQN